MTDFTLQLTEELKPGDRLVIEYLPETEPPPPPPSGQVVYDQPGPEEITADLPPLPAELHDSTKWHGLALGVTVDGVRAVYHADHEHGQPYPGWARELFGELIRFTGQELSYPWQTPNELVNKPAGYKYVGKDWREFDIPDRQPAGVGSVEAAFLFIHAMGLGLSAVTQFHSFFGAASLKTPAGEPGGIVVTGGWQNFGQTVIPYKGGADAIVPLPGAPDPKYNDAIPPYIGLSALSPDDEGHCHWNSVVRRESIPSLDGRYHRILRFAFRHRRIHQYCTGGIQTAAPTFAYYSGGEIFDPETDRNSSEVSLYQVEIDVPAELAGADGRVNFSGFTDLYGNIIEAAGAGPAAAPVQFIGCVPGSYMINYPGPGRTPFDPQNFHDGDVYFDADGRMVDRLARGARPSGWIGAAN